MASVLQTAHQYACSWLYPTPRKTENPIKIGVLYTEPINPASIIYPAGSHPDVVLHAIASKDNAIQAQKYAKKYGFCTSYGSYDGLLGDEEVQLVHVAVPNGLHYEWVSKALDANKHVLVETPLTSSANEATKLVQKANGKKRLVMMEGVHWQFHPAAHKFRQILDRHVVNSGRGEDERFSLGHVDGEFGRVFQTEAQMVAMLGVKKGDDRWKFDMGGGSLMDMGHVVSFTRFALRAGVPEDVVYARATPSDEDLRVDREMKAMLKFKGPDDKDTKEKEKGKGKYASAVVPVYSQIHTDLCRPWKWHLIPRFWELPSIRVRAERATIYFFNAFLPHLYHFISVTDHTSGKTTYEHVYKGGPIWGDRGETHWSSHRYQLEAVVDRLRERDPVWWISGEESVMEMQTVDWVYRSAKMAVRPKSVSALSE